MSATLRPRTQMTNGKPKRARYASFSRVNRARSPGVRRSRPAEACSPADSAVSSPARAARPARSGWARIRAS